MKAERVVAALLCLLAAAPSGGRASAGKRTADAGERSAEGRMAAGQSAELPAGRVVERVATLADPAQTYALYLPSRYTRERAWPALFCFDPLGRGPLAVEKFRAAAERYGWVVISSNNSRNGPLAPSLAATRATWADAQARLSLDARRLYTAGFSGGARQALRVNTLCGDCLAGVMAFGAGFPEGVEPSPRAPFAVFAAAGIDDFNFPEMRLLDERLARLSFPHRLELFEGGHAWPPPEVCAAAVEWMELQAMRDGRRARDEALVEALWAKARARAAGVAAAGDPYAAQAVYRALAESFAGLRDVAEYARAAERLRDTKEVKRAREEEAGQVRRQRQLFAEIEGLIARRAGVEEGAAAALSLRRAAADLRKAARAAGDTGARRVARRTLSQLIAHHYEAASNLRDRGADAGRVVFELEAASELAPDNPQLLFELACAYAADREKRKALAALRRAVENGFSDADAVAASAALTPLHSEPAFKELVERIGRRP